MKLSKAEEQLMEIVWQNDKIFLKDLLEQYPEPKPAKTTIATVLKRLQEKKAIAYHTFGNSRQYYALVDKSSYFSKEVTGIIRNYFGNSALQFASFFTRSVDLSRNELEDLKKIIDKEIKKKEK